ncbi:GNAT family N-acetyltransferase [Paenibacillus cisolokensis]|uniref:GNAT family N-acetyltransferase n=1 Tax=Paenibacillus cisolokensis TaxID=1658519 RepID=UPI003D2DCE86
MEESNNANNIVLRPLSMKDYPVVLHWSRDTVFCEANGWPVHRTEEELHSWWFRCVHHAPEDFIRMGIEIAGTLIGYVDVACIRDNCAEIGIAIGDRSHWGQGIGYAATRNMMEYGAETLGITVFYAEIDETNIRSRRMFEKIGFREIGSGACEHDVGEAPKLIRYQYRYT